MNTSTDPALNRRRRLRFGILAVLASATIAILIATGTAEPFPNLRFAFLLCIAVGVVGLIQLILAVATRPPNKSLERTRER